MEAPHSPEDDYYWGTLINADKSAAPLLEQLCLGLVQLMVQFESSHGSSSDLTPDKLARFYRQVGGNHDALFLETKGPALSFIYQALGCFHTLQPTKNPYEPPCIPALLPMGFVRWQVIQLLLSPDEHSRYLQNALCQWDVPNPAGGTFPKAIPRTAFPETADLDMLRWHEKVSRRLEKDHAHWHTTPRTSPADPGSRHGGEPLEAPFYRRAYFDTDDENLRRHRRRSQDAQRSRLHRFDAGLDSRTSSRNPSPAQGRSSSSTRMPTRSRTMRARNREYPEKGTAKKMKEKKQSHRKQRSEELSDSSAGENGLFPRRRRGSIDDRRSRRSYHLSPTHVAESESQRRHSHDATAPRYYKTRDRDYYPDYYSNKKDSRRYPPAKMRFYENMFDEPARPSRDANSTLPYDLDTGQIPRVHVRSDGTPADARGSTLSNGSGSSGSDRDRPRSSSGPANWAQWNNANRRTVPVYD
ncbi:hypothetical protein PISL3812_00859 [Talaromyces islandicus]|uniref:DUF7514 domain-containing protein n=1 Tax=Talaromyces islandicus TaxID=28573 RepID=A0A0U1LKH9_TALIS|nr:hypothetical protein PISL3812_00859 [Talaromyces islandicus]